MATARGTKASPDGATSRPGFSSNVSSEMEMSSNWAIEEIQFNTMSSVENMEMSTMSSEEHAQIRTMSSEEHVQSSKMTSSGQHHMGIGQGERTEKIARIESSNEQARMLVHLELGDGEPTVCTVYIDRKDERPLPNYGGYRDTRSGNVIT